MKKPHCKNPRCNKVLDPPCFAGSKTRPRTYCSAECFREFYKRSGMSWTKRDVPGYTKQ